MNAPRNVLVCEDDPVQLKVLEAAFRRAGYGTLTARSPGEALEAVRGRRAHAVVADVQLDRGNAFDLVQGLRRGGMDAPVIMMSAYATPGMRQRAVAAGAVEFFEKPCDPREVVRRVDRAVAEEVRERIQARVLVVEDHPQLRALYRAFLKQAGCEIVEAEDGFKAMERLQAPGAPVDMVLMDVHVPGPSGAALVQEMRRAVPGLFVAMVTGEAGYEDIQAGYRSGASALLRKPVSRQDLIAFVKASLAKAREARRAAGRARERAAEPRLRRIVRWVRSSLSAPKGSRRHKRLVTLAVGAAFVLGGLFAGTLLDSGVRAAEDYAKKADQALEAADRTAGPAAEEIRAGRAFQQWYLAEQVGLTREANEISRRNSERMADLQVIRGFQR